MTLVGTILCWVLTAAVLIGLPLGMLVLLVFVVRKNHARLHLSTLMLLSVLVSAFLGLNLTQHDYSAPYHAYYSHRRQIDVEAKHYGWPLPVLTTIAGSSIPCNVRLQDSQISYRMCDDGDFIVDDGVHGDALCAVGNLLLAMGVLLYAYQLCERAVGRARGDSVRAPVAS